MGGLGPLVVSVAGGWWAEAVYGAQAAWWGSLAGTVVGGWMFPTQVRGRTRRVERVSVTSPNIGAPLPVLYGLARVAGNIIWVGDFQQHEISSGKGGKGGGGKGAAQGMRYSVSLVVALCEGEIDVTRQFRIWAGGDELDLSELDYTIYGGSGTQTAPTYLDGKYADGQVPIGYRWMAYVLIKNLDLGSSPTVPNLTFQLRRTDLSDGNPAMDPVENPDCEDLVGDMLRNDDGDMNQAAIIADVLTHPRYGLADSEESVNWASFTEIGEWIATQELHVSPVLDASRDAASWLQEILTTCDCHLVHRQGQWVLKRRRYAAAPNTQQFWGGATSGYDALWALGPRGASHQTVADPDTGELTMVYAQDTANGVRIYCSRSPDGGHTWSAGAAIADQAQFADHDQKWPAICVTPNGEVHVVFFGTDTTHTVYSQVWYTAYAGVSWTAPARISDTSGMDAHEQAEGRCEADSQNRVHAVWSGRASGSYQDIFWRRATAGVWGTIEQVNTAVLPPDTVMHNYHPSLAIDSDDEPHVGWVQSHDEPPTWWWDASGMWPEALMSAPTILGFGLGPISRLRYRKRATTWQTEEAICQEIARKVESTGDWRKVAYPFVSPCLLLLSDDTPCLAWAHRPSEIFTGCQVYYSQRPPGGWGILTSPTRLSDRDGMEARRNWEPTLARTASDDVFLYWESLRWMQAAEWWSPAAWWRAFDHRQGTWGAVTRIVPLNHVACRLPRPTGPISPSASGYLHITVSDFIPPPDDQDAAKVNYCWSISAYAVGSPDAADFELGPGDWIEGGTPTITIPGIREGANRVSVTYSDRANRYNEATRERADDWDIEATGERREAYSLPGITRGEVAAWVADRAVSNNRLRPKAISVGLGPKHFQLAPGDLAELTDPAVELDACVGRAIEVREEPGGTLAVSFAEEPPYPLDPPDGKSRQFRYPQPGMVPPPWVKTETG